MPRRFASPLALLMAGDPSEVAVQLSSHSQILFVCFDFEVSNQESIRAGELIYHVLWSIFGVCYCARGSCVVITVHVCGGEGSGHATDSA